jgi:hypothetical protein
MRKATWGALALGLFALTFGSPIRESRLLHSLVSLAGLAGYVLLSLDPPSADLRRYRQFLIAGVVASLAAFVLAVTAAPFPLDLVARLLAVATVALPLWLVARPPQFVFVVAAALALMMGIFTKDLYATSVHAYVAAAGAFWVASGLHSPSTMPGQGRKPPRVVVASNIVTLTAEEKVAALARVEKRYRNGEIPEHKYWDLRQEIESR